MISKPLNNASLKPIVLSILAEGESYGYRIIRRIKELSDGKIQWTTGTLYPFLHSLENDGLVASTWRTVENAPRRKYYTLTPKGHRALDAEKQQWKEMVDILAKLWGPQPELSFS